MVPTVRAAGVVRLTAACAGPEKRERPGPLSRGPAVVAVVAAYAR